MLDIIVLLFFRIVCKAVIWVLCYACYEHYGSASKYIISCTHLVVHEIVFSNIEVLIRNSLRHRFNTYSLPEACPVRQVV